MSTRLANGAPDLVAFLGNMSPNDEQFAKLAKSITKSRTGVRPNVAALKFLKNFEGSWTPWVPDEVTAKVKAAIDSGKTDLINRKCIPDGGSGGGSPNCGT
jgi:hypothetical protein